MWVSHNLQPTPKMFFLGTSLMLLFFFALPIGCSNKWQCRNDALRIGQRAKELPTQHVCFGTKAAVLWSQTVREKSEDRQKSEDPKVDCCIFRKTGAFFVCMILSLGVDGLDSLAVGQLGQWQARREENRPRAGVLKKLGLHLKPLMDLKLLT